MTTDAPTPIEAATTLRAEMAEHMRNAIEAALFQLAPHLVGLSADSMAVILSEELLAVIETVQNKHLHRLAAPATVSQGEDPDALVRGAK